ncbi:hypothetical protein [Hymenobacter sp.]|uniref:DUF7079 family protein n=1 Tax=Hymenobacter sp. TaxID=1898978 RepID=UPI00286A8A8B|nr:hypothetical protein [Hymenobacter sp.]
MPDAPRRHPVWAVLAELYLDVELQEEDYRRMAAVCAASGFGWPEIRQMNYDEVAPVLWANLLSVAGEWAGWDETWLIATLTARYTGKRHRLLGLESLWRRAVDSFTAEGMARVAAQLP